MAYPTAVSDPITDSITSTNLEVLGVSPAIAMGSLYTATANAMANAAHNATSAQQQINMIAQASATKGVAIINAIPAKP